MKTLVFGCMAIVTVSCLSGCKSAGRAGEMPAGKRVEIHAGNFERIAGMQWILKSMKADGQDYPLTGEMPFIQFAPDGKVSGFASINRYFGSVQVSSKGHVTWSNLGSTRMAGPENLMKQEDAFLKALASTERLSVEGVHLFALSADGRTELVFYVPVK
ncbi:MAG TPA: META domain-containing protein [Anaerohalosphaeraceae bacterium]|nr:META domain-containing protein [Anaerohalosphaeraceae bacterium]